MEQLRETNFSLTNSRQVFIQTSKKSKIWHQLVQCSTNLHKQKLNDKRPISALKKFCNLRLNLIRKLAHTSYGADTTSLIRIYQALIRFKYDYGAATYSAATKTDLNSFNSIYHIA